MLPRILIVGTVPYSKKMTSRAFESYFHGWDREKIAQVFSNSAIPTKGHCSTLYQITDTRMLKRMFKKTKTGMIYNYDELADEDEVVKADKRNNAIVRKLYKSGRNKTPFIYLMRKLIWRKSHWCTSEFNKWLDNFKPECVFLSFSDDFFIPEIALYVAEKYDIPIVSSIGDDYYFNFRMSLSPFYYIYKLRYRHLIRKVLSHKGSAIYIGDKIRDKYNSEFGLNGETVYLTTEVKPREFKKINKNQMTVAYFGNIGGGRNYSLCDIADALGQINDKYMLDVYSNEINEKLYACLKANEHVRFHGSIPYSEVKKRILQCDIILVVEGFKKKDINLTRYSLSTKVADSLASGVSVFAYGSEECGAIGYMKQIGCAIVCTKKEQLKEALCRLIDDEDLQRNNYEKAIELVKHRHTLDVSTNVFKNVVKKAMVGDNGAKR